MSLVFPVLLIIGGVTLLLWPEAAHRQPTMLEEHPATVNIFPSGRHDPDGRSVPYFGIGMVVFGVILLIVRVLG